VTTRDDHVTRSALVLDSTYVEYLPLDAYKVSLVETNFNRGVLPSSAPYSPSFSTKVHSNFRNEIQVCCYWLGHIAQNAHESTAHRSSLTQYQSGGTNTSRMLPPRIVMSYLNLFSYDSLKKCIYQLEKQQHGHEQLLTYDPESNERSTLLAEQDAISTDAMFIPLLDRELRKIVTFYEHQEKELINDLEDLEKSLLEQEEAGLGLRYYDDVTDDDDDDSLEESLSPERRRQSFSQRRNSVSGRRRRSTSASLLCSTH
jgi:hypothetical protein